jgi:GNAT superfamily N-acetyltransferase
VIEQRAAAPGDEPFLRELLASARPDLAGWDEREREVFLEIQIRAQRLEWGARFPGSTDQILLLDRRPVGRVWVAWAADACVVVDLELLPEFRRKGLGTQVFEGILEEADRRRIPVRATAARQNTASIAFAARQGLLPSGGDEVYVSLERPVSLESPLRASA